MKKFGKFLKWFLIIIVGFVAVLYLAVSLVFNEMCSLERLYFLFVCFLVFGREKPLVL